VLFLCTGNSARSQMAEVLARVRSNGLVEAYSAGGRPKPLHPNTVRVMPERFGIDVSGQRTKHLSEFAQQRFNRVISLCDRVREVCPEFPGRPETIHWSIPDPAAAHGGAMTDPSEMVNVVTGAASGMGAPRRDAQGLLGRRRAHQGDGRRGRARLVELPVDAGLLRTDLANPMLGSGTSTWWSIGRATDHDGMHLRQRSSIFRSRGLSRARTWLK